MTRPSDNQKVWEWRNDDPFGANLPNENPSGLGNFEFHGGFPGMYRDKETGTFYNYFRDYDPATGRYVQSDPIGLRGGINTFGYVGGSPLSFFDLFGLSRMFRSGNTYSDTQPGGSDCRIPIMQGASIVGWTSCGTDEPSKPIVVKPCTNCDGPMKLSPPYDPEIKTTIPYTMQRTKSQLSRFNCFDRKIFPWFALKEASLTLLEKSLEAKGKEAAARLIPPVSVWGFYKLAKDLDECELQCFIDTPVLQ